jgi:hypothetical protein
VTAGRDHNAAALDAAALELAPGEHVPVFLPPALWPLSWQQRLVYRVLVPGLRGLFTASEWAERTLPPGARVIAGRRSYPAGLLAGLARDKLGCPVSLERATVRIGTASGPGSGRRHLVPCYLAGRER